MSNRRDIFWCEACHQLVEILHGATPSLYCCMKTMRKQIANRVEASKEKHIPIIKKTEEGVQVQVGKRKHSMDKEHFLEWIEVSAGSLMMRKFLEPGDSPVVDFPLKTDETITARTYCNQCRLWESKLEGDKNEE